MRHEIDPAAILSERAGSMRAERFWRFVSVVAAIGLWFVGWGWALAGFAFFQLLAYATRRHSVRLVQNATGLDEVQQALVIKAHIEAQRAPQEFDDELPQHSEADRRVDRPTRSFTPHIQRAGLEDDPDAGA